MDVPDARCSVAGRNDTESVRGEKRSNRTGAFFSGVVKTCCGGSSIGVYIVNDQEEYDKALKEAFSYEDEVVVEEFIQARNILSPL